MTMVCFNVTDDVFDKRKQIKRVFLKDQRTDISKWAIVFFLITSKGVKYYFEYFVRKGCPPPPSPNIRNIAFDSVNKVKFSKIL